MTYKYIFGLFAEEHLELKEWKEGKINSLCAALKASRVRVFVFRAIKFPAKHNFLVFLEQEKIFT